MGWIFYIGIRIDRSYRHSPRIKLTRNVSHAPKNSGQPKFLADTISPIPFITFRQNIKIHPYCTLHEKYFCMFHLRGQKYFSQLAPGSGNNITPDLCYILGSYSLVFMVPGRQIA